MEAYSPTSKYCILGDYSRPPRKCLHTSADYQETFCDKQREKADLAQDHFNQTLHEQCKWHPKSKHYTFECRALNKALGASLTPNTSAQAQ